MMATRHQNHIVIFDRHGFIQSAVFGINALDGKALGGVQAMLIGFFQIGHAWKIILVMAVAGIG